MKKRSKFNYTGRTREQVEQAARGTSRVSDPMFTKQFELFRPRDGKNRIRVLPPTFDGYEDFGLPIWVNYGVGPDNGAYLSLHNMRGLPDPIYEERQKANAEGDDEYAKSLAPRKRMLCWVIDRKAEDVGPQLWPMPASIAKNINQLSIDDASNAVVCHEHPDEGYDIEFMKEGQGKLTRYTGEAISRYQSPLSDDPELYDAWMQYVRENPLDEILKFYSYDHIAQVFGGGKTQQDSEEPVVESLTHEHLDEVTSNSGEEDDEVPWDSDEEEEEDTTPPVRASAGARRRFARRASA